MKVNIITRVTASIVRADATPEAAEKWQALLGRLFQLEDDVNELLGELSDHELIRVDMYGKVARNRS